VNSHFQAKLAGCRWMAVCCLQVDRFLPIVGELLSAGGSVRFRTHYPVITGRERSLCGVHGPRTRVVYRAPVNMARVHWPYSQVYTASFDHPWTRAMFMVLCSWNLSARDPWLKSYDYCLSSEHLGGWWRWALLSPDGVAPSRMVDVSASVNLSLHHKVQKFSSGTGSPGWSRKKGP